MLPGGAKWGTNPDALIDKTFKRLSENERYVDPGKHEREYNLKQMEKRTGKAFYPPKISNGPIGAPYPNTNDDEREAPKEPPAPRGVFTNPMKKGCPGTPGLTLGEEGPHRKIKINKHEHEHKTRRCLACPPVMSSTEHLFSSNENCRAIRTCGCHRSTPKKSKKNNGSQQHEGSSIPYDDMNTSS